MSDGGTSFAMAGHCDEVMGDPPRITTHPPQQAGNSGAVTGSHGTAPGRGTGNAARQSSFDQAMSEPSPESVDGNHLPLDDLPETFEADPPAEYYVSPELSREWYGEDSSQEGNSSERDR